MLSFDPITGDWVDTALLDRLNPPTNFPTDNGSTPDNFINPNAFQKTFIPSIINADNIDIDQTDRSIYFSGSTFTQGFGFNPTTTTMIKPDDNIKGIILQNLSFTTSQHTTTYQGAIQDICCGFVIDQKLQPDVVTSLRKFICTPDKMSDGSDVYITQSGSGKNLWLPPKWGLFFYAGALPYKWSSYYVRYRKYES